MSQNREQEPGQTQEKVKTLQQDASRVLQDITELSAKLREVGKSKIAEVSQETVDVLQKQLADLEQKASLLGSEGQKIFASLDKSVRTNPYLYILGAIGLGFLLGKSIRSQDPR